MLTPETPYELVQLLTPRCMDSDAQQAFVWGALGKDHPLISQIHYDKSPETFILGMVQVVDTYDPALLDQLIAYAKAGGAKPTPRVPFMAEDNSDFVPRPEEFEALKGKLLGQDGTEPVAITAALKGAGGYGKTTLAKALCHDEDIQTAFDDGILWVTLGEKGDNLYEKVDDLIYALTGAKSSAPTLETATTKLVELLADRDMLLVIDDVWDQAHLRPFLQGGKGCARLITTRNNDALPANAQKMIVDRMKPDEAAILISWGLPAGEELIFAALAKRIGHWPLLLNIINRTVRKRVNDYHEPLAQALSFVEQGLNEEGFTAFDDPNDHAQRASAVSATLGVSFRLLSADELSRFRELAIFSDDVDVSLVTVERFWKETGNISKFRAGQIYEKLANLSLLQKLDLETRALRLHDVIRQYLINKQNDTLPALHGKLLDAHRPLNGWYALPPDEPYLWRHIAYHFVESGRSDELCILLVGSPEWMKIKSDVMGVGSYIDDILAAIHNFDETANHQPEKLLIFAQLFTMLSIAVRDVESYSDEQLKILVLIDLHIEKSGKRTRQALGIARSRSSPKAKLYGLRTVYQVLKGHGHDDLELFNEIILLGSQPSESWVVPDRSPEICLPEEDFAETLSEISEPEDFMDVKLDIDEVVALDELTLAELLRSLSTIQGIEYETLQGYVTREKARLLLSEGHHEHAAELAEGSEKFEDCIWATLAITAFEMGDLDLAQEFVDQIDYVDKSIHESLAVSWAHQKEFERALDIILGDKDEVRSASIDPDLVCCFITEWINSGGINEVMDMLDRLEKVGSTDILGVIAESLALDDDNRALHVFGIMRKIAAQTVSRYLESSALRVLHEIKFPFRFRYEGPIQGVLFSPLDYSLGEGNDQAREGDFIQAFWKHGLHDPSILIISIATWSRHFDRLEQGLGFRVIRECVRIAGWSIPFWEKIICTP